jgi:RING finger/CHY zinc finger protein 1
MSRHTPVFNTTCVHYTGRWLFPVHPKNSTVTPCRICYDESGIDRDSFPRKLVSSMVCAFCACVQPCRAFCSNPECTAHLKKHAYYCNACHLWEHAPRNLMFHCEECGICRVGSRMLYRHCKSCGMCVPRSRPHLCWGSLSDIKCPVCYEPCEQHGRDPIMFRACGHATHVSCYKDLVEHGHFACPTCNQI